MREDNLPYAELKAVTFGIDESGNLINAVDHQVDVWNKVREGVGIWEGTPEDFLRMIINEHAEPPEFIQFSWLLHNVSRAFCAQLERNRNSSFWERSLRAYDASGFSEKKEYQPLPDDMNYRCGDLGSAKEVYDKAMKFSDQSYKILIKAGVPIEVARGVLPLHVYTKVWWRTDLRNFYQTIKSRTCYLAQREYWHPILMSMKEELVNKVHPIFQEIFRPPCKGKNDEWTNCIMPNDCIGRLNGEIKLDPCPLFENTPDYEEYSKK